MSEVLASWLKKQIIFYEDLDYTLKGINASSSEKEFEHTMLEKRKKLLELVITYSHLPADVAKIICRYDSAFFITPSSRVVYVHLPTSPVPSLEKFIAHTREEFQKWWNTICNPQPNKGPVRFSFADSRTVCKKIHDEGCADHAGVTRSAELDIPPHSRVWILEQSEKGKKYSPRTHTYSYPFWYPHYIDYIFPNILRHHYVSIEYDRGFKISTCTAAAKNRIVTETKCEKLNHQKYYSDYDFSRMCGFIRVLPIGSELEVDIQFASRLAIKNFVETLCAALRSPREYEGIELLPGMVIRSLSGQIYGEFKNRHVECIQSIVDVSCTTKTEIVEHRIRL